MKFLRYLYEAGGGMKTHLQFRLDLIEEILEKYATTEEYLGRQSYTPPTSRLLERHFLEYIPPTAKRDKPTREWKVCCSRKDAKGKKIRRETRTYCPDCNVGLCLECFKIFHTKKY